MARIPDEEIERLKQEVSLERLAEARGIQLTRHGADLIGLCPFHDDREPSLVITPEKNLWHCLGACQTRRLGDRLGHAGRRRQLPSCGRACSAPIILPLAAAPNQPVKHATVRKLPPPIDARRRRSRRCCCRWWASITRR